jgi:dTDP-4-amino-4,6-dideoxygalactose transaminase
LTTVDRRKASNLPNQSVPPVLTGKEGRRDAGRAAFPFQRPSPPPPEKWLPYYQIARDAHYYSNFGPLHNLLCERLAAKYGRPGYGAVAVNNATGALTAALIATEVSGKVVIPSFTFAATLHSVLMAGCTPVVCDIDPKTWELSFDDLELMLDRDNEIGAVMPVRVFGFWQDYTRLFEICGRRGVPVIVDAAAGLSDERLRGCIGSRFNQIEVVSMHATKVFAVGEGGAIFAPLPVLDKLRASLDFGLVPDRSFADGFNWKMDELHCAVALAMLDSIDGAVARRQRLVSRYIAAARTSNLVGVHLNPGPCPWQFFPLLCQDHEIAATLIHELGVEGIQAKQYYYPSLATGYRGRHKIEGISPKPAQAEDYSNRVVCLPVYSDVSEAEIGDLEASLLAAMARLPS